MELYSNMYQYLRQSKLKGYWGMKTSGEVSWTEKLDLNASFARAVSPGMQSNGDAAVQEKLGKIRSRLKAGARLTASEKEFLRKHDPSLYLKVVALEQEQSSYEDRLKKCRTRDDAERIKTMKMAELASNMQKEDAEYLMIRFGQMKEAEKKTASIVSRKPWQRELDKKQIEDYKKARAREDKKIRKKKAEKKRRAEAARKKRMEEKRRQEEALEKEQRAGLIEEERVEAIENEEKGMEMREEERIASELMSSEAIAEAQIAKFMIAAGMMDRQAARIQAPSPFQDDSQAAEAPLSLGSSSGYAAYKAAVDLSSFHEKEEEQKVCVRRA